MPQKNYTLTGFNWDKTLERMRKRRLILGDLADEEIERTKRVLSAHIKVGDKKVTFNLSMYGTLQISYSDNTLLRKAREKLAKIIVCKRWVPNEKEEVPQHTLNIVAGLQYFLSFSRPWYDMETKPKPDQSYAKYALQHLRAYPRIHENIPSGPFKPYFSITGNSNERIETARIYYQIEEIEKRLSERLAGKAKVWDVTLDGHTVSIVDNLLTSDVENSKQMLDETISVEGHEQYNDWKVLYGTIALYSKLDKEGASRSQERLMKLVLEFVEEEETNLSNLQNLNKRVADVEREFARQVDLLVRKLLDQNVELKGKCDICSGKGRGQ